MSHSAHVSDGEEFLFQEKDFEEDSFDPAAFVAKYRRVSSLESIRDQLLSYSKSVRTKLYDIINRDYKDFITISTKLDGVDTRLEMVEKPLFGLQMSFSSLHDGVATSLHAIQGKLEAQQRISRKKVLLQSVVQCMDELSVAQGALQLSHSHTHPHTLALTAAGGGREDEAASNRRLRLYRLAQALETSQNTQTAHTNKSLERDLFVCSEYERAAVSLSSALQRLPFMLAALSGEEGAPQSQDAAEKALRETVRVLRERVESAVESLTHKIRAYLDHAFSLAASTELSLTTEQQDGERERALEMRAFTHCLRALLCVRRAHVAEESLVGLVEPFLRQHFTAGKIDGAMGRNSFSGLADCLSRLTAWIERSKLRLLLRAAESLSVSQREGERESEREREVDLLVRGVVAPLSQHLRDKAAPLFSVSRAEVFSGAFRGVAAFLSSLPAALYGVGEGESERERERLRGRVARSAAVRALLGAFRTDLYLSLRCRECAARVDRLCAAALCAAPLAPLSLSLHEEQRERESETRAALSVSLSFTHELSLCVCVEAALALHAQVVLPPVALKQALFAQRLVLRLLLHEALCAALHGALSPAALGAVCPSLGGARAAPSTGAGTGGAGAGGPLWGVLSGAVSRGDFDAMRAQYFSPSPSTADAAPAATERERETKRAPAGATPSKSAPPAVPPSPSLSLSVPGAGAAQIPPLSADALLSRAKDALSLSAFVDAALRDASQGALRAALSLSPNESERDSDDETLKQSMDALRGLCLATALALLATLTQTLFAECKRVLQQVKSVAGKYRMTNKPAPQTPSSYVDQLFAPLRSLLSGSNDAALTQICESLGLSRTDWVCEILSAVCQALCEQMQSLCDTVRQMESALQRRSAATQRARSSPADQSALSDAEKIALQLRLDVVAAGKEVDALRGESSSLSVCAGYEAMKSLDLNCSS